MKLCLFFLLFLGAYADEVSLLDQLNTSKFLQNESCPPLFYGSNCQIPHCFTEHGHLARRGPDDYFCNCTGNEHASGQHCENINCNYGNLSISTFKCDCPFYTSGPYCELYMLIFFTIMLTFLLLLLAAACLCEDDKKSPGNQTRRNSPQPPAAPAPAPEIRIVERVVIQERSDAPPTYKSAVASADPPKYTV